MKLELYHLKAGAVGGGEVIKASGTSVSATFDTRDPARATLRELVHKQRYSHSQDETRNCLP